MAHALRTKPSESYEFNGITYNLDKLPKNIHWGSAAEALLEKDLLELDGYADCFSVDSIEGVRLINNYWDAELDPSMLSRGLWIFLATSNFPGGRGRKPKDIIEETSVKGILVLADENFVLESVYRKINPLNFNSEQIDDFFTNKLLNYLTERVSKQKQVETESLLQTLKDRLNVPEDVAAEIKRLVTQGTTTNGKNSEKKQSVAA